MGLSGSKQRTRPSTGLKATMAAAAELATGEDYLDKVRASKTLKSGCRAPSWP